MAGQMPQGQRASSQYLRFLPAVRELDLRSAFFETDAVYWPDKI